MRVFWSKADQPAARGSHASFGHLNGLSNAV